VATGIEGDFARIEAALGTPTLKLLDRKSAVIVLPIFAALFPDNAEPMPVERFHTRVDALLDELRASGHQVPSSSGKALAMQWVRERWLYRDPGQGQETYRPTGDAEQAMDYVTRATRTQLNLSLSRIETMRRVVSEAALAAHPDREERLRRLSEEIARLSAEHDRLRAGGELAVASESELIEQFANVLRELDGLPSDFRRVEEAMREMHRSIASRFRQDDSPIGEVLDDYLEQSSQLLTATPEGRAFQGALELLRNPDWLGSLRTDLGTILAHPIAGMMLPDETKQLRGTVAVIRRGIEDVNGQQSRLTTTLTEHILNYDHVRNRELDEVLKGIDASMRTWMQTARPRDHVEVELIPAHLEIDALKLRVFDPDSERPPEKLADTSDDEPEALSLEYIRKQGGPSLEELTRLVDEALANSGVIESAAALFNVQPDELRRPVEVLGLMHLLARLDAAVDASQPEQVDAVRPDGSTRSFLMPATSLQGDTQQQEPAS
jgi:hypothetical protein